ncbi:apolipoprotein N-acyltransferase [Microbacterium sp. zg.B48]|uniref:apolipoprotein N-acyltransferase n=1 Tax=Microbacterium sp. zg.B48 TaxID=2969408 RepID=UPI00214AF6BE|nr:apolipoprotein N-acyltransferase [Microbacterium sp. zg.B48]MCR2762089.1 apolipoprotein N-acyltransferase [Microbacterium sp. zg.B48]
MQLAAAPRPLLPLWAAIATSVAGGLLLTLAFPALAWWPMAFPAVALALLGLIGRKVWASALVGFAFGAAFFLVNLLFTMRYLGPVPWLALAMLEAVITAAGAIPITLAYRWLPRVLPGSAGRLIALPVLVAGLWTLREQIVGSWPYGGFPWGRIGITQAGSPLAHLASWVGVSGLSFVMVLLCAAAIEYVRVGRFRSPATVLPTAIVALLLMLVPQFPTAAAGTLRVGAVQGNGPTGYFDQRAPGAVLRAQLQATAPLFGEEMDVLLWPEGGVDSDPTTNPETADVLDALSDRIDAPLIVAAVTARDGEYFNTSMLWRADEGAVQIYDKRHPVPFGEYVPDRAFFEPFAPDLIGLIQREYTPGTAAPFFDLSGVGVGLAICFDVIYDDVIWDGAQAGAEVYMFQTNNADFRGTDENLQQLAFARMRAIETGRSVVNLSTVGTSQVIAPDGATIDGLAADEAGHMLTKVPLRTGLTPAVVAGEAIKTVIGWGSLLALIVAGVLTRRPALHRGRAAGDAKTPAPAGTGVPG